ncbi:MAG: RluA family pseudouridine synthase [Flavobacteriales bacterium]|nr:RluA family pseudouridine synthase [Flavobacteriales bacterium]
MGPSDGPEDGDQELYEHHRVVCDPGQSPVRLDKFLFDRLPHTSRSRIQAGAKAGNILVNEKAEKPSYKVKPGDVISVVLPYPVREVELLPEPIPLSVLYEDEHLVLIDKPAGLVVHPGHGNWSGTLVNALLYHFGTLPQRPGQEHARPGLVHRLDKMTSGVMVVGKSEAALTHLAGQFYHRTSDRRYLALIWGDPEGDQGTIEGHIGRDLKDRRIMRVYPDGDQGKSAITHWTVVERFTYVTLVECKLDTGRTHQIRAHMRWSGHPLFNDPEYGGDRILKGTTFTKYRQFVENCFKGCPRQALHARSLSIDHPIGGQRMHFQSELPDDMAQVISKWRSYAGSGAIPTAGNDQG